MKKFFVIVLSAVTVSATGLEAKAIVPNLGFPATYGMPFFPEKLNGVLGKIVNPILTFSQYGFVLSGVSTALMNIYSIGKTCKSFVETLHRKTIKPEIEPIKVIASTDEQLKKIKGQEKAKKRTQEIIAAITDARQECKENKIPYKRGDVIYMIGPSGVGKSLLADCLATAIMGPKAKPIYVDASDIDKGSQSSLKEQLFYMRSSGNRGQNSSQSYDSYMESSIIGQIKANPNVVLIINEYDKMHTPDFDEVLRTIMDRGQISVYGDKVDCSGLLVIITSNEDSASMSGDVNSVDVQDDGTGSRTHVVHDKSFLNRLNIIEFENLDEKAYEEIAAENLNNIAKRYLDKHSIKLHFGDTARQIAIKTAQINQGAREIEKIVAGLKAALAVKKQACNTTYNVNYNIEKDKFTLEKIDDNTVENTLEDTNLKDETTNTQSSDENLSDTKTIASEHSEPKIREAQ